MWKKKFIKSWKLKKNIEILKKVNIAENKENQKEEKKTWYDLRMLKKLKLTTKDKLSKLI